MDYGYRLSPEQERVWQLQKRAQPGAYRCRMLMQIDGEIDRHVLKTALSRVQQRHEILRTRFLQTGDTPPLQRVQSVSVFSERYFVLSHRDEGFNEKHERVLWQESESCPLNLTEGPTFAAAFVQIAASKSLLAITLPSVCADALTLANLAREVALACEDKTAEISNAEPVMQYADFARWKGGLLASAEGQQVLKHWREAVQASWFGVNFPGETHQPGTAWFQPRRCAILWDGNLIARLNTVPAELGISVSEWLFSCWIAFLWRFSQDKTFAAGYWIDGRNEPARQNALGLYGHYIPAVVSLWPDVSLAALSLQLQTTMSEQAKCEDYFSCDAVCQAGHEEISWPALFDCFEMPEAVKFGDRRWSILRYATCLDSHKLRFTGITRTGQLDAELEYNASLFQSDHISALGRQFATFVGSALQEPECPIGRLNCIEDAERKRIMIEFSRTPFSPDARLGCAHHWFEECAERHPTEIALVWKDHSLSYQQLNTWADALARDLQILGAAPETIVALSMPRSPELIVGVMGILKAGAAYLPLDPTYPRARLEFMLSETRAPFLVTQRKLHGLLPNFDGKLIFADEASSDWPYLPSGPIPSRIQPDHLAYVIYTSGSTGQPKGVLIEHRNLASSTLARLKYYTEPVGRYLMVSPISFDSSVAGVFWTLAQGGTLVLPEDESAHDPRYLLQLIAQQRVTHLLCLPSLYRYLLEFAGNDDLRSVQCVIVAGEPCPASLVNEHFRRCANAKLFNEYGPTEATVWSTVFDASAHRNGVPVPIGRPVSGASVYLLDSDQKPVPVGWPGEICVAGTGVARGYLNRPELAEEKFVRPPGTEPERMYRTGDIGRFRPDGNIEFLGRLDHQVKIRGYRVEVSEIEEILKAHSMVRDAVVVAERPLLATGAGESRHSDPNDPVAELAASMAGLDEHEAESLLAEAERLSPEHARLPGLKPAESDRPPDSGQRLVRSRHFDLSLRIRSPQFIRPPRESQRNWLLSRAINEAADDLAELHELAKRFVPGAPTDPAIFGRDRTQAQLQEHEILEPWHRPLMLAMARSVTEQHGDVLEVGFGRGISATMIQEFGVRSHTIVECNDYVLREFFEPWRANFPDRDIRLVHAKWQDALSLLGTYDGVFFQTFPLNEQEFVESLSKTATFAEHFFPIASGHLRNGGVFTYLSHEIDSISRRHQRLLFKYFRSVTISIEPLNVPAETEDLWWADSMAAIKAVK